jgi:hypothetical protein
VKLDKIDLSRLSRAHQQLLRAAVKLREKLGGEDPCLCCGVRYTNCAPGCELDALVGGIVASIFEATGEWPKQMMPRPKHGES